MISTFSLCGFLLLLRMIMFVMAERFKGGLRSTIRGVISGFSTLFRSVSEAKLTYPL